MIASLILINIFIYLHHLLSSISEWSKLCNVESPFEFRALEVALEAICSFLAARTTELEMAAYPALDELTSKVHILLNSLSSCYGFDLGSLVHTLSIRIKFSSSQYIIISFCYICHLQGVHSNYACFIKEVFCCLAWSVDGYSSLSFLYFLTFFI